MLLRYGLFAICLVTTLAPIPSAALGRHASSGYRAFGFRSSYHRSSYHRSSYHRSSYHRSSHHRAAYYGDSYHGYRSGGRHSHSHRSLAEKHAFWEETGFPHGRPGYIVDHVVPLACGGADALANMQWQTIAAAKAKDKWERKGCKR
jgi:hypothetical protein